MSTGYTDPTGQCCVDYRRSLLRKFTTITQTPRAFMRSGIIAPSSYATLCHNRWVWLNGVAAFMRCCCQCARWYWIPQGVYINVQALHVSHKLHDCQTGSSWLRVGWPQLSYLFFSWTWLAPTVTYHTPRKHLYIFNNRRNWGMKVMADNTQKPSSQS